jgi:hypothetical protein
LTPIFKRFNAGIPYEKPRSGGLFHIHDYAKATIESIRGEVKEKEDVGGCYEGLRLTLPYFRAALKQRLPTL